MKENLALDGIKIIDLSRLLPGGFCTQLLSDMGAEVIKVEDVNLGDYLRWMPPYIDGESAYFLALNRHKKSIRLNLKEEEGKKILKKLVLTSDVVLEGFRPGVVDRLGIGYEDLKKVNPKIIYCSITGYGQNGPLRDKAGHDINYISLAGILGITGDKRGNLILPAVQIGDLTGAMFAAFSILTALFARSKSGKGQYIDVAMMDTAFSWMFIHFGRFFADKIIPSPGKMDLTGGLACYNVYKCKDEKYISLGALESKFWNSFCQAINRPDIIDKQFVEEEQENIISILQSIFSTKNRQEWLDFFEDKDVCLTPINNLEETINHPQVIERELVAEVEHNNRKIWQINFPVKFSDTPAKRYSPSPKFGEHTEEVLKDLGYKEEEIEELKKEKIVL